MKTNGRITIYDIAREVGVSPATVSRVLSGHPNVSAKTREKVMRVVELHHFMPNSMARNLQRRQTLSIGIILQEVTNPYYASLYTAAYKEAQANGYSAIVFHTSPVAPMSPAFITQLAERRLDGALFFGGAVETNEHRENVSQGLNQLMRHMPLVTICPPIDGVNCINLHTDLSRSIRQSVQHLYALGHRRIAFLGGSLESRSASEREHGFLREMERLALPATYHREAGHTPEAGELATLKLLSGISREARPTALITINDLVALGALRQLNRMKINVPGDMAIVGCDNQFFSAYTSPPLTTVDNHPAELGRVAMEQLVSAIANERPGTAFTHVRESSLVVRESCGAQLGPRVFG